MPILTSLHGPTELDKRPSKTDARAAAQRTTGLSRVVNGFSNAYVPQGVVVYIWVLLKEVHNNTLTCREWNGSHEGASNIVVAKPYLLRQTITERNGYTYEHTDVQERTSTKTEDESTESQVILPDYYASTEAGAGDVLLVARLTGRIPGIVDDTGAPIEVHYIDCNLDGRYWAKA